MKNKKFFSLRVKPVNSPYNVSKQTSIDHSKLGGATIKLKKEGEEKTIYFVRVIKDFENATDADSPLDALKPEDVVTYLKARGFKPIKNAPNYLLGALKMINRKTAIKKMEGFLISDIIAFSKERSNIFFNANDESFYLSAFIARTESEILEPMITGHGLKENYGDCDFIICEKI